MTYAIERRFARRPELFGKGSLEAVAACEVRQQLRGQRRAGADANARDTGLRPDRRAARGLHAARHPPGPTLMTDQPDLVWGLIASMFVGNVTLLIMNLPLAPLFASLLRIPYAYLAPGILLIALVGAFATTLQTLHRGLDAGLRRDRLSHDQSAICRARR